MAYYPQTYYPQGFGYQPPMQDQLAQLRQPQYAPTVPATATAPQSSGILWAQGEEAAKAYLVAPGNSVLLMDSETTRFYIKTSDPSGLPLPLRIFEYKEISTTAPQEAPQNVSPAIEYATREEVQKLAERVEALLAKPQKKTAVKEAEDNA